MVATKSDAADLFERRIALEMRQNEGNRQTHLTKYEESVEISTRNSKSSLNKKSFSFAM
jgi:hypothetical protein